MGLTNLIETGMVNSFGGTYLVFGLIFVAIFIGFLMAGINFRFALLFSSPVLVVMAQSGVIAPWIGYIIYIFVIGFGMYVAYGEMQSKGWF